MRSVRGCARAPRDVQHGEPHVVERGEMREQRVVLEHEPDAARLRRKVDAGLGIEPRLAVDADATRRRPVERRRCERSTVVLPLPDGPDERQQLAGRQLSATSSGMGPACCSRDR